MDPRDVCPLSSHLHWRGNHPEQEDLLDEEKTVHQEVNFGRGSVLASTPSLDI